MISKQLQVDDKEALKQSIRDDMEVWNILFNQLINSMNKCDEIVNIHK